MAYCMYLRKSRMDMEAEARGEGETLARHRRALLEHAKRLTIHIDRIYEEIVSGDTIAARPVMQELLEDVQNNKWEGVFVMEVERLARGDTMDQGYVAQAFKWSNTLIITPMKTYNPNNEFDEEYFEFGLFMSRREYKTINRRLQRGREASAREGKFVGSIAPYGYARVKIEGDKGYTLKIVPEQARIVRLIFDWYTNGYESEKGEIERAGFQKIAHRLNDLGVPPHRNDYWMKETIKDILTNPTYAGKIRWGYRKVNKKMIDGKAVKSRPFNLNDDCIIAPGLHEAIVSEDTFALAQKIIAEHPAPPVGYRSEIKSPLAGIIICAKCGRKMVFRAAPSANKKPYLICHARACPNVSSPYELAEQRVLNSLLELLAEYEAEQRTKEAKDTSKTVEEKKARLAKLQSDIAKLTKQLTKAQELLEQEVYSIEEYKMRSQTIKAELAEAIAKKTDVQSELDNANELQHKKSVIIPKIKHVLQVYETLPSAKAKNDALKEVVDKAVYNKDVHGAYRGNSPDDFELVLYPKLI